MIIKPKGLALYYACSISLLVSSLCLLAFAIHLQDVAEWELAQASAPRPAPKPAPAPPVLRPQPIGTIVPVTFYSEEYRGKIMANGKPFDPDKFTCAHRKRRKGSFVTFTRTGFPPVTCEVTDRGPYDRFPLGHPRAGQFRKEFDLSAAAFRVLSPEMTGGEGLMVKVQEVTK